VATSARASALGPVLVQEFVWFVVQLFVEVLVDPSIQIPAHAQNPGEWSNASIAGLL
jgi:hypothetical protein